MDKIARIRQKIKELRELLEDHNYYLDNSEQALGYGLALDDIEKFFNTLSEEPDKSLEEADLEKEIDACWQNWLSPSNQKEVEGVLPKTEFAMYAHHFYELGKNSK